MTIMSWTACCAVMCLHSAWSTIPPLCPLSTELWYKIWGSPTLLISHQKHIEPQIGSFVCACVPPLFPNTPRRSVCVNNAFFFNISGGELYHLHCHRLPVALQYAHVVCYPSQTNHQLPPPTVSSSPKHRLLSNHGNKAVHQHWKKQYLQKLRVARRKGLCGIGCAKIKLFKWH